MKDKRIFPSWQNCIRLTRRNWWHSGWPMACMPHWRKKTKLSV